MSFAVVASVVYLGASVVLALMCARDMGRKGRNGEPYALAVLFVLPLGLAVWALDRRRPASGAGE